MISSTFNEGIDLEWSSSGDLRFSITWTLFDDNFFNFALLLGVHSFTVLLVVPYRAVIVMLLDLVSFVMIDVDVCSIELALKFLIFYQFTPDIWLQADDQIKFFFFLLFDILTVLVAQDGEILKVICHYLSNRQDCTQLSLRGFSCWFWAPLNIELIGDLATGSTSSDFLFNLRFRGLNVQLIRDAIWDLL